MGSKILKELPSFKSDQEEAEFWRTHDSSEYIDRLRAKKAVSSNLKPTVKIFAVYATVELTHKPAWLDAYRAAYDQPYPYHITLKQPCYISVADVERVKAKTAHFLQTIHIPDHVIRVCCNDVVIDRADGTIMLAVNDVDDMLRSLQQGLVAAVGLYEYYEAASEAWEKDFQPHITIARDLSSSMLIKAESEVPADDYPEGHITEITLVAVDKVDAEEAKKSENLTKYRL